ncbi:MAG: hypothetical protein Q7S58_10055 [Candidatus Binatus sp.]|nr:hypothetical protein [Candidatus Binatus sp.]
MLVLNSERLTVLPKRVGVTNSTYNIKNSLSRIDPLAIIVRKSNIRGVRETGRYLYPRKMPFSPIKALKFRYALLDGIADFCDHWPKFDHGVFGGGSAVVAKIEHQLIGVFFPDKIRNLPVRQPEIYRRTLRAYAQLILPQREKHEQAGKPGYEKVRPCLSTWPSQRASHRVICIALAIVWVALLLWGSILLTDRKNGVGGLLLIFGWLVMWLWASYCICVVTSRYSRDMSSRPNIVLSRGSKTTYVRA